MNHLPTPPTVATEVESRLGVFSVSDADDDLRQTVLSVINGRLSVDGTATATSITIPGSVADVNAKLGSLKYKCKNGFVGEDTLTMVSTDEAGGVSTTTLQINVQSRSKMIHTILSKKSPSNR